MESQNRQAPKRSRNQNQKPSSEATRLSKNFANINICNSKIAENSTKLVQPRSFKKKVVRKQLDRPSAKTAQSTEDPHLSSSALAFGTRNPIYGIHIVVREPGGRSRLR